MSQSVLKVKVRYLGPLAAEAGEPVEVLSFASPPSLRAAVTQALACKSPSFRRLVLDARGEPQPFVLVALDGRVVPPGQDPTLGDGAEVTLAVAVSGG